MQIERSIKKENQDENSQMKKELARKQRIKHEQKMKVIQKQKDIESAKLFGEIPMSLKEKSIYGYGFDLSKYKIDPQIMGINSIKGDT